MTMEQDLPSHPDDNPDQEAPAEDFSASAGQPLAEGVAVAGDEPVIEALRTGVARARTGKREGRGAGDGVVIDGKGGVKIEMRRTAPGCPVAGEWPGWVADAVAKVDGAGEVKVTLVWEPGWTPELMSEDAKLALGMD